MKTMVVLLGLLMGSFVVKSQTNMLTYVVTDKDTIVCEDVRIGMFKTTCVLANGDKIKVDRKDVRLYAKNNVIREKLLVYSGYEPTNSEAMMQLIANQNQIKVYKHYIIDEGVKVPRYYFYTDNRIVNALTNPSLELVNNYVFLYQHEDEEEQLLSSK